ncbi:MAG: hypothetical protein ACRDPC_22805 [Solirubrobacteraceae bacterium]
MPARTYHSKRKQHGISRADDYVGRTPVWREETTEACMRRWPGQAWRKG